jgi:uncharacterized protein (DUF302 family)
VIEMVDILRKKVDMNFDEAVKHVEKIVTEEGFTVMLVKAIDEIFKMKLGLETYPRYTTIMACGADLAKMAMDVNKDVGTLFPCSFVVYEDNGDIMVAHISIMKMAAELSIADKKEMEPVIAKTGERVNVVWNRI